MYTLILLYCRKISASLARWWKFHRLYTCTLNEMDGLLTCKIKKQLSHWIGKDSQFILLYKLSRDGGSAKKFHDVCDIKGPTVTIYYNTDNNCTGGTCQTAGGHLGLTIRQTMPPFFINYIQLVTGNQWSFLTYKEKLTSKNFSPGHGFIRCLHFKHQLRWMKNHVPTFTVSARLIFLTDKDLTWKERRPSLWQTLTTTSLI